MKVVRHTLITLSALALTLGTMVGCKSKKTVLDNNNMTKEWALDRAIDDMLGSELKYETLSTKGSIELKQGKSGKKLTAYYKIVKDSLMQASVRAPILGEVARINFTPDSIVILDRIRGRYAVEYFAKSEFMKSIDFNYYNLQALLTNKLFLPGKKYIAMTDYSKFKLSSSSDNTLMLQTSGKPNLIYNFAVDASEKIVSILVAKSDFNTTMQFTYSDFINDGGQMYPTMLDAAVKMDGHDLGVGISYSTLEIDKKDMKIDASIPKKYEKVSFSILMEPYIKMK